MENLKVLSNDSIFIGFETEEAMKEYHKDIKNLQRDLPKEYKEYKEYAIGEIATVTNNMAKYCLGIDTNKEYDWKPSGRYKLTDGSIVNERPTKVKFTTLMTTDHQFATNKMISMTAPYKYGIILISNFIQ